MGNVAGEATLSDCYRTDTLYRESSKYAWADSAFLDFLS